VSSRQPRLTLVAAILVSLFLVTTGCGQNSDSPRDPTAASGTIRGFVTTAPSLSSSATEASLSSVPGAFCFVMGADRSDTTDRHGTFIITDVPAGRYPLSCEKSDAEGRPYALLAIVEVETGQVTDLGWITITQTGRVQGTATLADRTEHTGIRVSLPPLALETTTDASGAFVLDHVPAADYEMRFERGGYQTTVINAQIGSQQTTFVSGVSLPPE